MSIILNGQASVGFVVIFSQLKTCRFSRSFKVLNPLLSGMCFWASFLGQYVGMCVRNAEFFYWPT